MGQTMKTADLAKAMGVSRNTVSMWREVGLIQGEWRGHGYVYTAEEYAALCMISKKYRISNKYYAQLALSMMNRKT